ncbi:MAG: hypothetical protein ACT4NV_17690 [Rhodoferax sp.]
MNVIFINKAPYIVKHVCCVNKTAGGHTKRSGDIDAGQEYIIDLSSTGWADTDEIYTEFDVVAGSKAVKSNSVQVNVKGPTNTRAVSAGTSFNATCSMGG